MLDAIICAIITGGLTLIGVIVANNKNQAVMEAKLEELTREVREHNNFARRVPVAEVQIQELEKRLTKLESAV